MPLVESVFIPRSRGKFLVLLMSGSICSVDCLMIKWPWLFNTSVSHRLECIFFVWDCLVCGFVMFIYEKNFINREPSQRKMKFKTAWSW